MEQQDINTDQIADTILITLVLGQHNPGAITVVNNIFKFVEENNDKSEQILDFIIKLINKNIIGVRLWYIYKNEANMDLNNLFTLDLDKFTNEYFYERIDRFL